VSSTIVAPLAGVTNSLFDWVSLEEPILRTTPSMLVVVVYTHVPCAVTGVVVVVTQLGSLVVIVLGGADKLFAGERDFAWKFLLTN
jgi:hypothetical protein